MCISPKRLTRRTQQLDASGTFSFWNCAYTFGDDPGNAKEYMTLQSSDCKPVGTVISNETASRWGIL